MSSQTIPRQLLHPSHWANWLLVALLRCVLLLPYSWLMRVGTALGWAMEHLDAFKRYVVLTNLKRCFPELDRAGVERLKTAHYRSMGQGIIELMMAWWWPQKKLDPLGVVKGMEHLERAQSEGKGVILLAAHVTSLELCTYYLARKILLHITYKHEGKKAFLSRYMHEMRRRRSTKLIASHDLRAMLSSLRQNEVVWYAPDQDFGKRNNLFAPFFGIETGGVNAISRICEKTGARVVPFFAHRLPNKEGYEVVIKPPLEHFPSGDQIADATVVNSFYEESIRLAPEQYLWFHRRFRSRPEGEAPFYVSKHHFKKMAKEEQKRVVEALFAEK